MEIGGIITENLVMVQLMSAAHPSELYSNIQHEE
jgi:hypothetical protein